MSATSHPSAELCAIDSPGSSLRVRFTWSGNRYGHTIELTEYNQTRVLLESIEGTEQDEWPPSPPIQNVNVSRIVSDTENRRVAMLVGGAGASHWSMCVAVSDPTSLPRDKANVLRVPGEHDLYLKLSEGDSQFSNTELIFDVACRIRQKPGWLGSTYRVLAAPFAVSEKLNCACIPVNPPRSIMVTHNVGLQMETHAGPMPLLRCNALANSETDSELPATIRWRYTLRFLGSTPRDFDQAVLRPST